MRNLITTTMTVLVIVGACQSTPAETPSPDPAASVPPADASLLRYACDDGFPFGADLLGGNGGAETADTSLAAALRDFTARDDMDIAWLPDDGWILAGENGRHAQFLARDAEDGVVAVILEADGGSWKVTSWGGCQPQRVLPDGLGDASWVLGPGEGVDPTTIVFTALVTERDCASGRSSEGRVVGPDILLLEDEVLVTFAVRPLGGEFQDCQGNPPTRMQVTLPEPLGGRRLLDGSTLPPREPVAEP